MTTNVIDQCCALVASDSRWSITVDAETLIYVDDTGFDKIADRQFASMICAGDGLLIDAWKQWFAQPVLDVAYMPATERIDQDGQIRSIAVSLVTKPDGRLVYCYGWYLDFEDKARFSGSGATAALACYSMNKCGRTAVGSAGNSDPMTGGETKFVDAKTGEHNLHASLVTLQEAHDMIQTRGYVMNTKTGNVIPFSNWNQTTPMNAALSSGAVTLSAPIGVAERAWTATEKSDLKKALQALADFERAAQANS